MIRYANIAAGMAVAAIFVGLPASMAQTTSFRLYHCADGSEFVAGFYPYDPNAYLQIDGAAVKLTRRLSLSGARYSAPGVTLRISKAGRTTIKRRRGPATACESK